MIKLFVVGFPRDLEEQELREIFEAHGEVGSVTIITDKETGESKCFGFVVMDDAGALKAISALDGGSIDERTISVRLAEQKQPAEIAFSTKGKKAVNMHQQAPKNGLPAEKKKRPRLPKN